MLHLVATFGVPVGAFVLVAAAADPVSRPVAFALVGFPLTFTYNALLPVEMLAIRRALDSAMVADPDEARRGRDGRFGRFGATVGPPAPGPDRAARAGTAP